MKVAFVFPGQGSQYMGMAKEFYAQIPEVRALFEEANEALGWDVAQLCFEGPETDLVQTSNTQPALLTASIACLKALEQQGLQGQMVAGHSLGEYSALVAAQSLGFADAVRVVRQRGLLMEAAGGKDGGMAAVLGLDNEQVVSVCAEASAEGLVEPANYNCPGQVVISGTKAGIAKAMELAKAAGAKRVIELSVSGPFHSGLMQEAGVQLEQTLAEVAIKAPAIPVIANVSTEVLTSPEQIRRSLVQQVSGSVRWEQSVRRMIEQGVTQFVEVGPGKVLSGLIKKINREVQVVNVEDPASLENALAKMGRVG